ncbi:unnamed protein product [Darwinula stevensoni]|uniref:Kinetochore protein SPC25 n=1 Tax=Darwinula stevensoni TaxID=69355 RepID=A0A7R9A7G3_9CRUS|nr:unnamed protein product [Darwinula stevensoni]CAG0891692.1 unnamed protein product [Darwinula stevensoni]
MDSMDLVGMETEQLPVTVLTDWESHNQLMARTEMEFDAKANDMKKTGLTLVSQRCIQLKENVEEKENKLEVEKMGAEAFLTTVNKAMQLSVVEEEGDAVRISFPSSKYLIFKVEENAYRLLKSDPPLPNLLLAEEKLNETQDLTGFLFAFHKFSSK